MPWVARPIVPRSRRNRGTRGSRSAIVGGLEILTSHPLAVSTLLWEAAPNEWTLTLCVKVTLTLEHGHDAFLADVQEPVTTDKFHGEATLASLRVPSDLVPLKPRADVILVGHAYAPGGVPTPEVIATLAVGSFSKSLRVLGDRVVFHGPNGPSVEPPSPFSLMPLRYERAAIGAQNPVGVDGTRALPNVEACTPGHMPGFGPVSPDWSVRRDLLDEPSRLFVRAMGAARGVVPRRAPSSLEHSYFNAAPPEQRLGLLRPGLGIVLENMHPMFARFETRLPSLRPRAYALDPGATRPREIALRCDTLWIDADEGVMTLSFRGLAGAPSADENAHPPLAIVLQADDLEPAAAQLEALLRRRGSGALVSLHPLSQRHDAVKGEVHAFDAVAPAPAVAPHGPPSPPPSQPSEATEVRAPSALLDVEPTTQALRSDPRTMELTGTEALFAQLPFAPGPAEPIDDTTTDAMPDESTYGDADHEDVVSETRDSDAPLDVSAYAALAVALERGDVMSALAAASLPPSDLPHLLRAFAERAMFDVAFARLVADAMEAARARDPLP